ncbi:MAG: GNAT family N-acetyltransferase [Erysipelotrichaceae bacterium]|nr:GNAT family N-acetyltransferase [Erysipelotrichaceae bacterium]
MHYCKNFSELSVDELYRILKVREEVFIIEQSCIYADIDDLDPQSSHLWIEENGQINAYLRFFQRDDTTMQIGRVLTRIRGVGLGRQIVAKGIDECFKKAGITSIYIEAQCYAEGFYERLGFKSFGEPFDEDGIPHIKMRLRKDPHND